MNAKRMSAKRKMLETQVRLLTESIDGKWTRLVEDPRWLKTGNAAFLTLQYTSAGT
jgi:hypothetical protein